MKGIEKAPMGIFTVPAMMLASKLDKTSFPDHSMAGRVIRGMELIQLVGMDQNIAPGIHPEHIVLLGRTFRMAEEELSKRGITMHREGEIRDDDVIVRQIPETTMQIIQAGEVTAYGVSEKNFVKIKLYDDLAPKTIDFFRHALGLLKSPVGELPVFTTYENTRLFKTEHVRKELMPENTPSETVPAGEIGVTNQSARCAQMIGMKLVEDSRYGPSGEKFAYTNIIGRVIDIEKLHDIRDGDVVYVTEV
ncbi:MAG: methanogenesis marker 3 protein [Euryarchaeota archaeon]|nr:methanogenesis marker 3 protein [Euryarchaeota archaeon]